MTPKSLSSPTTLKFVFKQWLFFWALEPCIYLPVWHLTWTTAKVSSLVSLFSCLPFSSVFSTEQIPFLLKPAVASMLIKEPSEMLNMPCNAWDAWPCYFLQPHSCHFPPGSLQPHQDGHFRWRYISGFPALRSWHAVAPFFLITIPPHPPNINPAKCLLIINSQLKSPFFRAFPTIPDAILNHCC